MRPSAILVSALLGLGAAFKQTNYTTTGSDEKGFTLPVGIEDGIYTVHIDNSGTAHHVKVAESGSAGDFDFSAARIAGGKPADKALVGTAPAPRLSRRQWRYSWRVHCTGGQRMDPADTDFVVADVKRQCGSRRDVPSGWHIYAVRGSAAGFYCNFVHLPTSCSSDEFRDRAAEITAQCGLYVAGWNYQVSSFGNPVTSEYHVGSYGYHAVDSSRSFCGRTH